MSMYSRRLCIKTKWEQNIFETFKIIIKGCIFWICAKEVSGWIPNFVEEEDEEDGSDEDSVENELHGDIHKVEMQGLSEDDSNVEAVPETYFNQTNEASKHESDGRIEEGEIQSDDPFNLNVLLQKKNRNISNEKEKSSDTLKYPPGFTPVDESSNKDDIFMPLNEDEQVPRQKSNAQDIVNEDSSNRGAPLSKEEGNESRCSRYFRRTEGPRAGCSILQLLGDVVKVGQIMGFKMDGCDPGVFCKHNSTISDYFVAIQGDFIEVRHKEERFGSIFNNHNAMAFNSFISSGGLVEVPLGGCTFTWCHKSGNKMSKLDRFLISEGLMVSCRKITAITLDRYLSDHRPTFLREVCYDYGPIPFRMFHYWFEWEGFDRFIVDT
ncbi:RNA-directed DNA polymerase, eukaryota [Tanacetum coccineum]